MTRSEYPDRVGAILVRELRRACRGWALPALLLALPATGLVICQGVREPGRGDRLLVTLFVWLAVPLWWLLPLSGFEWIRRELGVGGELRLVLLGDRRITVGRLTFQALATLFVLACGAPFLAFAWLVGGLQARTVLGAAALLASVGIWYSFLTLVLAHRELRSPIDTVLQGLAVGGWVTTSCGLLLASTLAIGKAPRLFPADACLATSLALATLPFLHRVVATYRRLSRGRPVRRPLERWAPGEPLVVILGGLRNAHGSRVVVDGVRFHLDAGEILGLVGPRRAGKSTTLRLLAGLESPDAGSVRYGQTNTRRGADEIRGQIGYVPDRLRPGCETVLEHLDFFARAHGLSGAERRARVDEVADFAGLTPSLEALACDLPAGPSRRLALARAVIHDPAVLLLDEPFEGLDPRSRAPFEELLRALAEEGRAILVTGREEEDLRGLADRIVRVEGGRVVRE